MTEHRDPFEPEVPIPFDEEYVDEALAIDADIPEEALVPASPRPSRWDLTKVVAAIAAIVIALGLMAAGVAALVTSARADRQETSFSEKAERRSICSILNQGANNELERATADLATASADLDIKAATLARAESIETALFVEGLELVVVVGDESPRLSEILGQLASARIVTSEARSAVETQEAIVDRAKAEVGAANRALEVSDSYTLDRINRINAGEDLRCTPQG